MADSTLLAPATTYGRYTFLEVKRFVASLVGLDPSNLQGNEPTLLAKEINAEVDEWRTRFPQMRGFGQAQATLTWPLETPFRTRIDLPDDFAELLPGGRAYFVDSDGATEDPLEIVTKETWENSFQSGTSQYDTRSVPLGILWGISTGYLRQLEIRPTPEEALSIRFPYLRHAGELSADGDYVEAPVPMNRGIAYGAAAAFLDIKGDSEKAARFAAKKREVVNLLLGASGSERKRPARFLPFEGYHRTEVP